MSIHQADNISNSKEEIKKAIEAGDIVDLLRAGFDNFMSIIFEHPISFHSFLDYTGQFFDEYVLETEQTESLCFAGGKFTLEHLPAESIAMSASFYFQDAQRQWIMKEKKGQIGKSRFSDWNDSSELQNLRQIGKLEFPIDPPHKG